MSESEAIALAHLLRRVETLERLLIEHLTAESPVSMPALEARHQRFRARLESHGEEL